MARIHIRALDFCWIGLLLGLAVICTNCTSSPKTQPQPVRVRVMSFNIHHGEGLDGRVDLERIAELIKHERIDLVGLQEVDKGTARTGRRDFPAELARITGFTCVFSNNFNFQGGEYGNAILSRFPVKHWKNHHYRMLRPNEQRGLLAAEVEISGRGLMFMTTHLDSRPDDSERWSNLSEIEHAVAQLSGEPVIVCGDFNTTPDTRVYERLTATLNDAWTEAGEGADHTFPAAQPQRRIDYIWYRKKDGLNPVNAWVPASDASDHLPVVVEFEYQTAQ